MALLEKQERPGGESEALSMSLAGDETNVAARADIVRCTRCERPLRARKSVLRGLGPVCCQAAVA